ncbi:MAG: TIGR02266 family protein [Deltaproteobacteria bacterium]|nr:TIGR02266 family protein [Deltaproteobacteria bacterium]
MLFAEVDAWLAEGAMNDSAGNGGTRGTPESRRQSPRLKLDYDLEVDVLGEHVPFAGLIKDISSGGLFITTEFRHKVGDELQIRFTFPALADPVEATVRVQWFRDEYSGGGMPAGIGVQFVDLPEDVVRAINQYIRDKEVHLYEEGF